MEWNNTCLLCERVVGVPPEGLGELLGTDALVAGLQSVEHPLESQGHARHAAGRKTRQDKVACDCIRQYAVTKSMFDSSIDTQAEIR